MLQKLANEKPTSVLVIVGAARQQAIAWANADLSLSRHMALLGPYELIGTVVNLHLIQCQWSIPEVYG